jgi:predicted O-methyltransferase YrrM
MAAINSAAPRESGSRGGVLDFLPARLRSLLSRRLLELGARLQDAANSTAPATSIAPGPPVLGERLAKIEQDIVALRSLVRARDDRSKRTLRAGLSSLLNVLAILPQLRINGVIPPFPHQGFEITGEEAAFLYHLIRRHRPKLVMELGSGSSTFLFAAAVRANGSGRVLSVEHDDEHASQTRRFLEQAELSEWVQLVRAPLIEQSLGDRVFLWYDLAGLLASMNEKIDLLFVDGPPGKMQSLSRYPALPLLAPHLSPQAFVFVDDGGREDELRMIELWRGLNDIPFEAETLSFLPRAPVLLKFGAAEPRIAELHLAREDEDLAARRINVLG